MSNTKNNLYTPLTECPGLNMYRCLEFEWMSFSIKDVFIQRNIVWITKYQIKIFQCFRKKITAKSKFRTIPFIIIFFTFPQNLTNPHYLNSSHQKYEYNQQMSCNTFQSLGKCSMLYPLNKNWL